MSATKHAHDFAVGAAVSLNAPDVDHYAVSVHGPGGRILRDIDVALQSWDRNLRRHERVAVAVNTEAAYRKLATGTDCRIVAAARFDQVAPRDQFLQLRFNLAARRAGA